MAKKQNHQKTVTRVIGKTATRQGNTVWSVATSSGKIENITTRSASTAAINEAMVIYGPVLQRLADR